MNGKDSFVLHSQEEQGGLLVEREALDDEGGHQIEGARASAHFLAAELALNPCEAKESDSDRNIPALGSEGQDIPLRGVLQLQDGMDVVYSEVRDEAEHAIRLRGIQILHFKDKEGIVTVGG